MELYLLDEHARRIAILPEYESLSWRSSLVGTGADVKLPRDLFAEVVDAVYLERSDSDTILFINKKSVADYSDSKGCFLSAVDPVELYRRRVLFRTRYFTNVVRSEVIRDLSVAAIANLSLMPAQDRSLPLFSPLVIERAGTHLNATLTQQMSWGSVFERIESVLEELPIRFFSRHIYDRNTDSSRIEPTLYEGRDLTSDVVLSTAYGDLSNVEYNLESQDRKNTAIIAGQGEGLARIVASAQIATDSSYGELWVDANDIGEESGIEGSPPLTPAQQRERLQARGAEKLHEEPCERALSASVEQARFRYGQDYRVADRVSFEVFGVRHEDIISEVEEVFEGTHSHINITIGTKYPTIRQIVDRSRL